MTATLQINTNGAWRNLFAFDLARKAEVVEACRFLAREAPESKWCILHADFSREFLFTRKRPCT